MVGIWAVIATANKTKVVYGPFYKYNTAQLFCQMLARNTTRTTTEIVTMLSQSAWEK